MCTLLRLLLRLRCYMVFGRIPTRFLNLQPTLLFRLNKPSHTIPLREMLQIRYNLPPHLHLYLQALRMRME